MEQVPRQRLKGYVKATIVAMRYYYKSSDGQRLPNPPPGCFVSLQLEPSNPYHHNAIKVINEADTRHLGYIVREIADALAPLLKDKTFICARGILSNPVHLYNSPEGIPCQVLLFFAVPPELVPPLSPYLDFHEDLSSPHFMLARTPVAFTGSTLAEYDSYANSISGGKTFARLQELRDLEPLPPQEGMDGEAVGMSTIIECSATKEKKEKVNNAATSGREEKTLQEKEVAGQGKRRLPPRPRLDRACKKK